WPAVEVLAGSAGQTPPVPQSAAVTQSLPIPTVPAEHTWYLPHPPNPPTPESLAQKVLRILQVPPPAQSVSTLLGPPAFVPSSHQPALLQTAGLAQPKALTFWPPGALEETP